MPTFELRHTDELKAWLIKELEPICDADPEVLSDYVLALLKHDASDTDLQATLQEQLEDFLAEQTGGFVLKTLTALRSQTYLPAAKRTTNASSAPGSAPASDAQAHAGTSRKRSADDEGRQSPAKTSREVDGDGAGGRRGRDYEGREQRYGDEEGHHQQQQFSQQRGNGRRSDGQQRQKPMCRDFHQRGYCARGDSCKFDHSLPSMPVPMMPGQGLDTRFGNPGMMGAAGGPPMGPASQPLFEGGVPHPGANNAFIGGSPHLASMQGAPGWNSQPNFGGSQSDGANGSANGDSVDLTSRMGGQGATRGDFGHRGARGVGPGGMRGGRGGGPRGTFEKRHTSNTTLVIENVPQEHLELVKVNEYFKKFGTITNIQIDVDGKKALVSYAQPGEAKAAHSSPEVIFGNRFVKVYFQKLDDPFVRPKEAPAAPTVVHPPPKSNFIPGQTSNKFVRPDLAKEKAKEAQESAQKKLDGLMSEQKEIMATLTGGSATGEEKKAAMARFGPLEKEIKQATEEVRAAVTSATAERESSTFTAPSKDQREQKEREQLDRELEAIQGGSSGDSAGNTTEELKATLARLQAEAAQLGIDSTDAAGGGRGGFRGRGRAVYRGAVRGGYNSFYRGRGAGAMGGAAASRSSMSLDNRTSKLHITDIPDEQIGKVKEHLMQFGEIHSVEDKDDGTFIINYKARSSGERALRSGGLTVPDVGTIKAQWTSEGSTAAGGAGSGHGTQEPEQLLESAEGYAEGEDVGDEDEGDREEHFRR